LHVAISNPMPAPVIISHAHKLHLPSVVVELINLAQIGAGPALVAPKRNKRTANACIHENKALVGVVECRVIGKKHVSECSEMAAGVGAFKNVDVGILSCE